MAKYKPKTPNLMSFYEFVNAIQEDDKFKDIPMSQIKKLDKKVKNVLRDNSISSD